MFLLQNIISEALISLSDYLNSSDCQIFVTIPNGKIAAHYCTNILFLLDRNIKNGQHEIFHSALIAKLQENPFIQRAWIVNRYINFTMSPEFFIECLHNSAPLYPNLGQNTLVNVEYCSVNPTGPLHIGHARNAILGDAIATLLQKTGFFITREYYINDAGNQIYLLGLSVWRHYAAIHDLHCEPTKEKLYDTQEVRDFAASLAPGYNAGKIDELGQLAVKHFLARIKSDLNLIGIVHDKFVSEREIIAKGYVEKAIALLKNHVYSGILDDKKASKGENSGEELQLLRTTTYGDDQDRPLVKANGEYSYFAPDIGYHLNKIERDFSWIICILGADHDSYANRIKIAVKMLCESMNIAIKHDVLTCQIVSFEHEGQVQRLSKRLGNAVSVSDFVSEVPQEVLRYMILSKSPNTQFIFDYENALNVSMQNPIFYIQYAHARCCSIFRSTTCTPLICESSVFAISEYQDLIVTMSQFHEVLEYAVKNLEVHSIALYCYKLAESFHKLWQAGKIDASKRFIVSNETETSTRLAILDKFRQTLAAGLEILGIKALEQM